MKKLLTVYVSFLMLLFAASAMADFIDPASYTTTLEAGEEVTIRKTVTIEDRPATATLDVMFLFDTSGSMGSQIAAAKTAANAILAGLATFGDLASGVGYYSEPGPGPDEPDAIIQDLSLIPATTAASINTVDVGIGGFGGDFPEEGIRSVTELSNGVT